MKLAGFVFLFVTAIVSLGQASAQEAAPPANQNNNRTCSMTHNSISSSRRSRSILTRCWRKC